MVFGSADLGQVADRVGVEHGKEGAESRDLAEAPGGACGERPSPALSVGTDPQGVGLVQDPHGMTERAGDIP
ncbi:MAG: hypothetical protein ACRDXC_03880 [Acidimicrobiales bacterium]